MDFGTTGEIPFAVGTKEKALGLHKEIWYGGH